MTMMFEAQVVPLQVDDDNVIRVGGTRVTLSTIVHAFDQGHTPEEIVVDFPALQLVDVYAVITYYLNNRAAVEIYLADQEQLAAQARDAIEARSDSREFRQRLLARAEHLRATTMP